MKTLVGQDKPDLDSLAHFGVKGMKWGHHQAQPTSGGSGSGGPAPLTRKQNRELNKASRKQDNADRNAAIDKARERFSSGQARQDYLNAKAQYKVDKKTIGTREARKKFNVVKEKNMTDGEIAQQAKSGKETATAVLAVVGAIAVSSIIRAHA
jgi:hypothetical protein